MMRTLDVYLHEHRVGKLIQDAHGQMLFEYAESWLSNPQATPLSHSLPLSQKQFNRNACRGFFAGVLPDENKREVIATVLGISSKNDFAMLEKIGGECAGAVTFVPGGQALQHRNDRYERLDENAVAMMLKQLPRRPLMAGEDGVRLSLAGAQDKIAVRVSGTEISIPLDGAPSTHIIKPAVDRFEGLVFNEALCMKLSRAIGLNSAHATTGKAGGIDYLLVERYDRSVTSDKKQIQREHQEDFCQALGIAPEIKYQAEGGPSLKQSFSLLREVSSAPVIDLQALLDAVIFNFLVGNHDAHGKNFSVLYGQHETRLAPLYDLLCTSFYPELSSKMAMKIGGEYLSSRIGPEYFGQLAEEAGLAKPMVKRRVPEIAERVVSSLNAVVTNHPVEQAVASLIHENCRRTLRKFTA